MSIMSDVTEYAEGFDVELVQGNIHSQRGRWIVKAWNEGGNNTTEVDVEQLVAWLKANRPDLLGLPNL